ncbi:MAG: hypothetical protein EAZ82_07690 [Verrucomicrobia bacterium]|nr:MAG: hypothetical protein EAZ82_07690 [Verrucomicrobiota bacterium]
MNILEPKFEIGKTYATPAVTQWAGEQGIDLTKLMWRHHCGEWGDLCDDDKSANDEALETGDRILSAYQISGRKIYIITEYDRSKTTIMLATEY